MKVLALNGSPRKNRNTSIVLKHAMEGAASKGAETELINLYDYKYQGCISCFACKLKGGNSYGKCAVNDDLKAILNKVEEADALLLGSPIYFGQVTSGTRAFLERLMFQYLVYDQNYSTLFARKIPIGLIYTMNVPQKLIDEGYLKPLFGTENALKRIFGMTEALYVTDTYQFDDYSKYETSAFDAEAKAQRRKEVFPLDCQKAYELGIKFADR